MQGGEGGRSTPRGPGTGHGQARCDIVDAVTHGDLILAGTPIGDVADASPALRRALVGADIIAAEDTRRLKDLLRRLDLSVTARVVSYFDGNEAGRATELVANLLDGLTVVVVTDAGMPSVSDPGFRVVQAAIAAGVRVSVVPGPSAVLTALAISGLPSDRFCFEGFLPRKAGPRRRRLDELAVEPRTMVFFEAPHRLEDFLVDAAAALGDDRPAAVCRELTKTYEEVRRASLRELVAWAHEGVRGEITVVIAGYEGQRHSDDPPGDVLALVAEGATFKDAVARIAVREGLSRGDLYDAALARRKATP